MSATVIAGYLTLFALLGFGFLFVNLLVGKLVRPAAPNIEKLEVYECGEPTIGSSFVQFDLRFYVVALLFIIFDVEIAFFFPWGTVFGKATHLMDPDLQTVTSAPLEEGAAAGVALTPQATAIYNELGFASPAPPLPEGSLAENAAAIAENAQLMALSSIFDILVFFGVLMVGFAYVWKRGDLDWVRAVSSQRRQPVERRGVPLGEPGEHSHTVLAG